MASASPHRRRLLLLAAAIAAIAAAVVVFLVERGGEEDRPPATAAAQVVPADALFYFHLSTDADRPAVKRALEVGRRFPSYPDLRTTLLGRLSGGRALDFERDVRPWLGDEAALALLDTGRPTAGSLVVLAVADVRRARSFVKGLAQPTRSVTHRGVAVDVYGGVAVAFHRARLLIGQLASVRAAIDVAAGARPSLARAAMFRRATSELPPGRVLDAFLTAEDVRRVLAPQGGLIGAVGTLLDDPRLQATELALTVEDPGARLTARSLLTRPRRGRARASSFDSELVGDMPRSALAYLGLRGLDRAVGPILTALGAAPGGVGELLRQVGGDVARRAGVDVQRDLLPVFRDEVALVVTPRVPAPVLTLVARARDERAASEALGRLRGPLARLLEPRGEESSGQVPVFRERDVGGVKAYGISLGPSAELIYAVFDGKVVVSTSPAGIRAVRSGKGSIEDADGFRATLGARPGTVSSLVFLDFNQLLTLAEQTGLNDSPTYVRVRDDLRRIRALGAATTASGGGDETTSELRFQIP